MFSSLQLYYKFQIMLVFVCWTGHIDICIGIYSDEIYAFNNFIRDRNYHGIEVYDQLDLPINFGKRHR
jgi:hypothetical protein